MNSDSDDECVRDVHASPAVIIKCSTLPSLSLCRLKAMDRSCCCYAAIILMLLLTLLTLELLQSAVARSTSGDNSNSLTGTWFQSRVDSSSSSDRQPSLAAGHGLLPSFLQPQIASICHALVGDRCPKQTPVPYDDCDSSQHPIMGNTKKYDVRFHSDSGREVDLVSDHGRPPWPDGYRAHRADDPRDHARLYDADKEIKDRE